MFVCAQLRLHTHKAVIASRHNKAAEDVTSEEQGEKASRETRETRETREH